MSNILRTNKDLIDKIAEKIYEDKEFYSNMKLATLNLIQRQEPFVLEYVARNRLRIENEFNKKGSRLLKKTDFLTPNIA